MDPTLSLIAVCCSLHLQFEGVAPRVNPAHYQQANPGVGVEYERKNLGSLLLVMYRDSYGKGATCAAYSPYRGWARPFVGLCDGYVVNGLGKIAPAAGLNIEPWHRSGPTITITPMNLHGIVIGFAWKESL